MSDPITQPQAGAGGASTDPTQGSAATQTGAPGAPPRGPERPSSFSLDIEQRGISDAIRDYIYKVRSGHPGALPSILALIILTLIISQ
jgi:hypothetical protein